MEALVVLDWAVLHALAYVLQVVLARLEALARLDALVLDCLALLVALANVTLDARVQRAALGRQDARAIDGRAIDDRWNTVDGLALLGGLDLGVAILGTRCGLGLLGELVRMDALAYVHFRA